MFSKFLKKKGFTLVEALVSLALLGFLVVAVTNIAVYVSESAASNRVEESLHSIAISYIENKKYNLRTTGSLPTSREVLFGEIGDISYALIGNTTALSYEGAYSVSVIINAGDNNISNEVILYA